MNRLHRVIAPLGWQRPPAARLLAAPDNPDDAAVPEVPGILRARSRSTMSSLPAWGAGARVASRSAKRFYPASVNRIDDARRVLDEVARTCLDEPLVMQYFPRARAYFDRTKAAGQRCRSTTTRPGIDRAKEAYVPETPDLTDRAIFRFWSREVCRYGDTDRQGHVNNAAFVTFCETGRVLFLYDDASPLAPAGCGFVIARLELDFRAELHWREVVDIGTVPLALGRSSFTLGQGLFVGERCVATAQSVLVLIDERTRRATPLPDALRARLLSIA